MAARKEFITLGSGDLYIKLFEGGAIPEDVAFETEDNKVGEIKGGAEISYAPEIYEVLGDSGVCLKRFILKEEVTFKSGLLTWCLDTLNMICLGGSITKSNGKETVKIGGSGAKEIKRVALRFVHTLDDGKKIRVTMVGTPSSGFTLTFNPEEETVIDAEFQAMPMNSEGILLEITKEVDVE
ncbi:hypothetical protein P6P36_01700 [Clostridium perfringens]|nr:hypothetical protein [Clostridium perfringens]MDK0531087.1 hypothetical protein [Clostridium perfringens]